MVKGFGGKYGTVSKFKLEAIPDTTLRKALEVVHLSDQLISIQNNYLAKHQSTTQVLTPLRAVHSTRIKLMQI